MSATVAAGLLANLASNAMADAKAYTQFENEQELMNKQNSLNQHNALMAYSNQVQGAKLAGLNPAMLNGATPQVAAPVSKGNAAMAENVEFDPATLLMDAQRENLEAQTEKTQVETEKIAGVDTENTKADTQAKRAATLLNEAQTDTEKNRPELIAAQTANTKEETQRIKNLNNAFAEENSAMGLFGQTMAQNWQKEPWYNKLSKGSKMVIDDIANGNLDLTVGIANALDKSISTDQNMNETEKNKFEYELTEKVIEAQMKNPKVMKALEKLPSAQYNELIQRASKLATENKVLKFNLKWDKEKKDVWDKNDPDKLYREYQKDPTVENAAKWIVSSLRNTGTEVLKSIAPAAVQGTAVQKGLVFQGKGKLNQKKIDKAYQAVGKYQSPFDSQKGTADFQYQLHTNGVQSMKK